MWDVFGRLVKQMMYGFGDDENPLPESIELLEEMVIHFIQNMVSMKLRLAGWLSWYSLIWAHFQTIKAMEINKQNKVQIEDIMYLLRKDPRKYARAKDLLIMDKELKKARKAFDEPAKY